MQFRVRNFLVVAAAAGGLTAFGQIAAGAVGGPTIVRGTITRVKGNTIDVRETSGGSAIVHLTKGARVASVRKASLSEVKPGTYIGTAAVPQPNGSLQALEIHIFPASMRGVGEGTRAWNLVPHSSMTNGTVAQKVNSVKGDKVTVDYRGGHKVVTVTPKTEVVSIVPGSRSELKPNMKVFIARAIKNSTGSLEATSVTVGANGLAPPM